MDLPKLNTENEERSLEEIQAEFLKIKKELDVKTAKVDKKPAVKNESQIEDSVPKKVCAIEVVKHLKMAKWVGMGAIGGVFIVLLGSTFALGLAYAASFIMIVPAAIYLQSIQRELKRLQEEYGLQTKKGVKRGRV